MRIGRRIGVGVAVLGLVLGIVQAATAGPDKEISVIGGTVTLVTGDQVIMQDGKVRSVRRGAGREKVTFSHFTSGGHVYVIPTDARQLVSSGRLDRRLFDLTTLVEFGYDDAHRDTVPLIVTHPAGRAAPRIAAGSRELPSINGIAVAADKNGGAWESLTDGTTARTAAAGVSKVWLDGKVRSTLDRSAAQIGAPTAWAAGVTGAGVKVAVLDTGVDQTHPDLAGREIAEQNFSDAPDNVDNYGHGTHVASILAGTGAKSGGKYRGIASGVSILDGKVLDDTGWGTYSEIVAGMEWAAQQGADIVNMSLGGTDTPEVDPLEQAVESLTAQYGTLFVVAAGNRGPFGEKVSSPGSTPSALTVGAVKRDDSLADFSLGGPTPDGAIKPDVTAPGVGIVAAQHSAGTEPPVEDGYIAHSGTSMAAPHVAGAAALLAQQHPDWTGQQLKAALMSSAKPTPGLTPFQQGTGRVDVPRALNQTVVSEPVSLNFGTMAWPHDDDQPVTKPLTYRNLGTSDVTLDLTVDNPVFSLNTNKITVPAGGAASLTVTGDARLTSTDGTHSATVLGTANGSVTRTPVTIVREVEKHDLTLNYVDEHGQPTNQYSTAIAGLDDGSVTEPYDEDGSVTVRLPKGRYVISHNVTTQQGAHENVIMQADVLLDRDQTFEIDPTITKPISVKPPAAARFEYAGITFRVRTERLYFSSVVINPPDLSAVSTAQVGDMPADVDMYGGVATHWVGTNDEQFVLAWFLDRFPTGFTKAVRWSELATLRRTFNASGAEGDFGVPWLVPHTRTGSGSGGAIGFIIPLPTTQTAYITTENVRWESSMWLLDEIDPIGDLRGAVRTYRPGHTYQERFNHPMFGPGLPATDIPFVTRRGNVIEGRMPLFTDQDGHAGSTFSESGSTKLYLDDQLVGETPYGGYGYFPDLPTARGNYRLTAEVSGLARFAPTTSISAEWTFSSSYLDDTTLNPVEMNAVRFFPKLSADGAAPAGRPFTIPLKLQDETGEFQQPKQLTVEVSYDEGKTWQRVPVTSDQVAKLNHPAGATSVSLRASAADRDGNTVKQTIIRAYTLR